MSVIGRSTLELEVDRSRFKQQLGEAERDARGSTSRMSSAFGMLGKAAVAGTAVAGAAIAGLAIKGTADFIGFERQMNEVFTLLPGISQEAMGEMTDQVKDFSQEFGTLPNEVVPALYQSISAGVPKDNVFEFLETAQKAAIGGVTELETAVDGISSVVNAYGDDVLNATQASDLMFTAVRLGKTNFDELSQSLFQVIPTASSLGVEFGDVTAALATMTAQGTPTNVATTQLRQAFVELSKEGSATSDTFKEIAGSSFKDFIAEGGNTAEALNLLAGYADETGVGINDLFGSVEAGNAALALTGKGAESFASNLDEMAGSAGATDAAFETMDQGIGRSIDRIRAAISVMFLDIGESLAPFVSRIAGSLEGLMPRISGAIVGLFDAIGGLVSEDGALNVFFTRLALFLNPDLYGTEALMGFGATVSAVFGEIRDRVSVVVGVVGDVLSTMLGFIGRAVTMLAGPLATAISIARDGFMTFVQALQGDWSDDEQIMGIHRVIGNLGLLIREQIIPAIQQFASWIQDTAIPALVNFGGIVRDEVMPPVQTLASWLLETGIPAVRDFAEWFINSGIPSAVTAIGSSFNDLREAVDPVMTLLRENKDAVLVGLGAALMTIVVPAMFAWTAATWASVTAHIAAAAAWVVAYAPLIALVVGVGLAAAGLYAAWQSNFLGIQDITSAVWGFISPILTRTGEFLYAIANDALPVLQLAWAALSDAVSTYVNVIGIVVSTVFGVVDNFIRTHGDTIMAVLGGAWEYISQTISNAVTFVQAIIQTGLLLISGDWSGAWETMKVALGAVWDQIKLIVSTASTLLGAILSLAWDAIRARADEAWNGIKTSLGGIVDSIRTSISDTITGLSTTLSGIWTGIREFAVSQWESLRDSVLAIAGGVRDSLSGIISDARDLLGLVWTSIRETAESTWSSIGDFVENSYERFIDVLGAPFRWLRDTFNWDSVSSVVTTMWQSIEDFISGAYDRMVSALGSPFEWFESNVGGIMSRAASYALGPINAIIRGLNVLGGGIVKAVNWIAETLGVDISVGWTGIDEIGTNVPDISRGGVGGNRMAHGGIIDEPVRGVGLWSGEQYDMGEAGRREAVIPLENDLDPRIARALNLGIDPVADPADIDDRTAREQERMAVGAFFDPLKNKWDQAKDAAGSALDFMSGLPSRAMDWLGNGAEWALERVLEHSPLDMSFPGVLSPAGPALIEMVKEGLLNQLRDALGLLEEAQAEEQALMTAGGTYSGGLAGWVRPLVGIVTQLFGQRALPGYGPAGHTGVDIAAATGSPIRAANSGLVTGAGWMGGYGNAVTISHGVLSTLYGHMSRIIARAGQTVSAGDIIGLVGSTGYSTGPHLHLELRRSGATINPAGTIPFHEGGRLPEDMLAVGGSGQTYSFLGGETVVPRGGEHDTELADEGTEQLFSTLRAALELAREMSVGAARLPSRELITNLKLWAEHAVTSVGDTIAYLDKARDEDFLARTEEGSSAIGSTLDVLRSALDLGRAIGGGFQRSDTSAVTALKFAAEHAVLSIGDTIAYIDKVRDEDYLARAEEGSSAINAVFSALTSALDFTRAAPASMRSLDRSVITELKFYAEHALASIGDTIAYLDTMRTSGFIARAEQGASAISAIYTALTTAFDFSSRPRGDFTLNRAIISDLKFAAEHALASIGDTIAYLDSVRQAGFVDRARVGAEAISAIYTALVSVLDFSTATRDITRVSISRAMITELKFAAEHALTSIGDTIAYLDHVRSAGFVQRAQEGSAAVQAVFTALTDAFSFAQMTGGQRPSYISYANLEELAAFAGQATIKLGAVLDWVRSIRTQGFLERAQEAAQTVPAVFSALSSAFDFAQSTGGERPTYISYVRVEELANFAGQAVLKLGAVLDWVRSIRTSGFFQRAQEAAQSVPAVFAALSSAFDFAQSTEGNRPTYISYAQLTELANFAGQATLRIGDVVRWIDSIRNEGYLERISAAAPAIREAFGALGAALSFASNATAALRDDLDVSGATDMIGSLATLTETAVRAFDRAALQMGTRVLDSAQRFAEAAKPVLDVANSAIQAVGGIVTMQEILPRDQEMFVRNIRRLGEMFAMANDELDRMGISGEELDARMAAILDTAKRITDASANLTSATDVAQHSVIEVHLNGRMLGSELAPHIVDEIRLRTGG